MSVFYNYNTSSCTQGQSSCPFSIDPSISSLKELMMYELKQIAYYIVKLDELSVDTKQIRDKVIYNISLVSSNLDFKREVFNKIIQQLREDKKEIENNYLETCKQQNTSSQLLKPFYDLANNKTEIVKAINEGEKQALLKNTVLSKTKKNLHEIIINLIQTCCLYLSEIDDYETDNTEGKKAVIELLYITNFPSLSDEKWKSKILKFSKINFKIMKELKELMEKTYGPLLEKEVEIKAKKGPAILVSGHFIKDLKELLEATKNESINIYTHNGMILAHSVINEADYPNLAGHYQATNADTSLIFESFPGPILITKNSQLNKKLIRGRIFTTDKYPTYGLSKVENYDFSELIKVAKESRGFNKECELNKIKVGFNKEEILNKLKEIFSKVKSGEIKHLYIIDIMKQYPNKNDYLEKFFNLIPDNHFAISLSYPSFKENIWHIDSYYDYSVILIIISELMNNDDVDKEKLTAILTQCNSITISHILNLENVGIKSIYLGNCCPLTTNPSMIEGICDLFGVNYMTDFPEKDFESILLN